MAPSLTYWHRLEPSPHGAPFAEAVQARLHDPLWLLGRQWQVGEFAGEDAGTPVHARLRYTTRPLARWCAGRPAPGKAAPAQPYDPGAAPLEAIVQLEPPAAAAEPLAAAGAAARAGLDWLTTVRAALGELGVAAADIEDLAVAYRKRYPLVAPSTGTARLDPAGRAWLDVAVRRSLDGAALAGDLASHLAGDPGTMPSDPALPTGAEAPLAALAARWLERWPATAAIAPDAWDPERLQYRFALGTATGADDITVVAPDWDGRRLDAHAFDHDPGTTLEASAATVSAVTQTIEALPSPAVFPGMPLPRWWAFEDAAVALGASPSGPDDLAALLLLEFALIYGNDCFLLPVTLPLGSLTTIDALVVGDTFGVRSIVRPAAEHPDRPWRAWTLAPAEDAAGTGAAPGLLLVAGVADGLSGAPLERVRLLRDEMADLVWAVEREFRDELGRPADRAEAAAARRRSATMPPPDPDAVPAYRLASPVPDYWYPMPADGGSDGARLELQLLPDADTGIVGPPRGRLLGAGLQVREEEIGRDGVEIARVPRRARWTDGTTHAWVARRRAVGRGEGSSGLRFDRLQ